MTKETKHEVLRTQLDVLRDCRKYVATSRWVAETEYADPESDLYQDERVNDEIEAAETLLNEIDSILSTKH